MFKHTFKILQQNAARFFRSVKTLCDIMQQLKKQQLRKPTAATVFTYRIKYYFVTYSDSGDFSD